jgi:hypothetical protein
MDSFGLFVTRYYEECCKISELINVGNKTQVPASRKAVDQMTVSWVVTQCRSGVSEECGVYIFLVAKLGSGEC